MRWLFDAQFMAQKPRAAYKAVDSEQKFRKSNKSDIGATHVDPEDPEKGQWGGSPKRNGRQLTAKVKQLEADWFAVTIEVKSTNHRRPLEGDVIFHLHPTLIPKVRAVPAKNGVAKLRVESYGAYTVGVEADDGETKLEFDLSEIRTAPLMFRLN